MTYTMSLAIPVAILALILLATIGQVVIDIMSAQPPLQAPKGK